MGFGPRTGAGDGNKDFKDMSLFSGLRTGSHHDAENKERKRQAKIARRKQARQDKRDAARAEKKSFWS